MLSYGEITFIKLSNVVHSLKVKMTFFFVLKKIINNYSVQKYIYFNVISVLIHIVDCYMTRCNILSTCFQDKVFLTNTYIGMWRLRDLSVEALKRA